MKRNKVISSLLIEVCLPCKRWNDVPAGHLLVLGNYYHGAYRQGIIRGVPPSPNVSAQTPYVLGGWATPVWSGGCPCRLLPYVYPSSEHCPLYGYRPKTRGDLYTSTPYNANWALYFLCSGRLHWKLRSPTARICRIKRSFAFYVLCECARHHLNIQNAQFHFLEGTWS